MLAHSPTPLNVNDKDALSRRNLFLMAGTANEEVYAPVMKMNLKYMDQTVDLASAPFIVSRTQVCGRAMRGNLAGFIFVNPDGVTEWVDSSSSS